METMEKDRIDFAISFLEPGGNSEQNANVQRTCFGLNWPKLAWCQDRWNVYTMHAVQLICTIFVCFYLHNFHIKKEMYFCFIWQNYPTGILKNITQI